VKAEVTHLDGRKEIISFPGENMALGLSAVKHTCMCGQSRFIDGGDEIDCGCGRHYRYFEDEAEQAGYLH